MRHVFLLVLMSVSFQVFAAGSGQQYYEQGVEAFKSGNYKNAELLFRKTIDSDDEYTDRAWYYLSQSLYQQKKYKDAIFEFNRFLLNCRTPGLAADSRFWIGEAYYSLNDNQKAIEEYKRYISVKDDKSDPNMSIAGEKIGDIYFREMRYDEAILEWNNSIEFAASNPERKSILNVKIAQALFENKKFDEAESMLNVLTIDKKIPVQYESLILMGRINQAKARHRIALRFFTRIPDNQRTIYPYYNVLYFMGLSYLELNEKDNARNSFQTFVRTGDASPYILHAKYNLAMMNQSQNPNESSKTLEEISKTTTDKDLKISAALECARIYLSQGKYEAAIPILENNISDDTDDKNKQISYDLGNAYLMTNNLDKAEKVFTEMQKKYSFDSDADRIQFLLSVVFMKKGNSKMASDGFRQIRDINPFSKYLNESNYYLATAQYDQGLYKNSIKLAEEYAAAKNIEKAYEANILILNSYIKLGDSPSAEKIANNIMRKYSDKIGVERVILSLCRFLIISGKESKQAENFIIKNYPDSESFAELFIVKGNYYFDKNDWNKADLQYSQLMKARGNDFNIQIFIRKVMCMYYVGNYEGVVSYLSDEKMSNYSKDSSSQIVLILARSYYMLNKLEKSYELFLALSDSIFDDQDNFMFFESAIRNENMELAGTIAKKFQNKKDYYYRVLFTYGSFYKDLYNYQEARNYFGKVYAENTDSLIAENAQIEIADIDYREGRFGDLIDRLKNVKHESLESKKDYLLLASYNRMGRVQDSADIVKRKHAFILTNENGRTAVKDLIALLEDNGDIKELQEIGKLLSAKYPADNDYINYAVGNYYYKNEIYDKSLQFLLKINISNRDYKSEVCFKIAKIYELNQKNIRSAQQYFLHVVDSSDYDEFVAQSKIELSMIYFERGQKDASKKMLEDILARKENIAARIKAQNLMDYYGLDKDRK